jgi:hypothetical protein
VRPAWKDVFLLLLLPIWATISVAFQWNGLSAIALQGSIGILAILELIYGSNYIKKFRGTHPTGSLPKGMISYVIFIIWSSGGTLGLQFGLLTGIVSGEWIWVALACVLAMAFLLLFALVVRLTFRYNL